MRYMVRRPYRYGNKVYMPGEAMPVTGEDVKLLQSRQIIGAPVVETASVKPPENAMKPKAKPKKLGGGWFELASGKKVRKSELKEGEI